MGFRGFPGTDLRDSRNTHNHHWDPGNLPNTLFALAALLILDDKLEGVDREALLCWLPRLQRADGSFGELLGRNGAIEGGRDLRYCCCAAAIAFILKGGESTGDEYVPFDIDRLIDYILNCQSFEGGFGESPLREPHSGLNYCAVATLDLLSRLEIPASLRARSVLESIRQSNTLWLLDRQTTFVEEYSDESNTSEGEHNETDLNNAKDAVTTTSPGSHEEIVGFNGRTNKMADTCYCFWNSGALAERKTRRFGHYSMSKR